MRMFPGLFRLWVISCQKVASASASSKVISFPCRSLVSPASTLSSRAFVMAINPRISVYPFTPRSVVDINELNPRSNHARRTSEAFRKSTTSCGVRSSTAICSTAFFTFAGAFRYGCFAGNISRVLPALNRNICAFGVRVYSSPMAVALSLSERG